MQKEEILNKLQKENIVIIPGLMGYLIPLELRLTSNIKEIWQLIDVNAVKDFHLATKNIVTTHIKGRAEQGIKINNLMFNIDIVPEIEKTDINTLKEARMLKSDLSHKIMVAVFGDFVTFTVLDLNSCVGIIVKNKTVANMGLSIIKNLWRNAVKV